MLIDRIDAINVRNIMPSGDVLAMNDCLNPDCGEPISNYALSHCEWCGDFIEFPNYRKALAERGDLDARYQAAVADIQSRGEQRLLSALEDLATDALPVISMSFTVCRDLLSDKKYENYFIRCKHGDRDPAKEADQSNREKVSGAIYPGYGEALHYAVLSPNRRGLKTYGQISVTWNVSAAYIGRRASLLERNEFEFYEEHGLGGLHAVVPSGYRSIWDDRVKLVVAKLAPVLRAGTAAADLPSIVLQPGSSRGEDKFVEIVIYGERGIDGRDVAGVHLEVSPASISEHHAWEEIEETCVLRRIAVSR